MIIYKFIVYISISFVEKISLILSTNILIYKYIDLFLIINSCTEFTLTYGAFLNIFSILASSFDSDPNRPPIIEIKISE